MSKHTPGPWFYKGDKVLSNAGDGDIIPAVIARVIDTAPQLTGIGGDVYANARLMASAPELLAALTELLARVDERCGGHAEGTSPLVAAARAAIAKAE